MSIPRTRSRHLDGFISENQRNSQSKSQAEIDRANDEALQQALRASLAHDDDGLTAAQRLARDGALTQEQQFALATRDAVTLQQANDHALALGIAASLDPASTPKKAPRTHVPDDELIAQRALSQKLKDVMQRKGYEIHPNSGNGNNCLIISMLQHVTGNYHSNHEDKAKHYKQLLVERSGGTEKTSNSLFSDNKLTQWLIAKINRDYFGKTEDNYVKFKFVVAGPDGEPAVRTMGVGQKVGGIIDLGGHYEAYTARA